MFLSGANLFLFDKIFFLNVKKMFICSLSLDPWSFAPLYYDNDVKSRYEFQVEKVRKRTKNLQNPPKKLTSYPD